MNNASSFLGINMLEAILHPQQDEEIDIVAEMEKENEDTRLESRVSKDSSKDSKNTGTSAKRTKTSKGNTKRTGQNEEKRGK